MARFSTSRIIPLALILIIAAVAIAALVSLARVVFFSNSTESSNKQADTSKEALLSTDLSRAVRVTVRGSIVADEQFRSYQIVVTPSSRTLTTYNGYLDTPIDKIALANNVPAYEEFVYALSRANMVKGTEFTGDKNDTRGICATGQVYQFDVLKDNKSVKSLWTSTCGSSKGSLDGNAENITDLFISQVPDADKLIRKIDL